MSDDLIILKLLGWTCVLMFLVSSFYHQFGGKFRREKYSNKLYSNLLLEATPKFGNYDSYVISGIY